jgi:phosphoglycolate phosphatase-like HAD superfamily hydrolase
MFIFDIDGTLSDPKHRLHLIVNHEGKKIDSPNWDQFLDAAKDDEPIWPMVQLLQILSDISPITLSTGRREDQREMTEEWLDKAEVPFDYLIMRPVGDYRSDTIVKPERLLKVLGDNVHPIPGIITIFEDRKRVSAAWRKLGYHVCQVAEGDY